MPVDQVIAADVLIIGAGNAGLRAAIEAAGNGARTVIVSKGPFPSGGSTVAGGLLQASFHPQDSKDIHFRDTVEGGWYLNNQRLVRILVDNAPDRVLDAERFGHVFDKGTEARYALTKLGGYSVPRAVMGGISGNLQKVLFLEAFRRGVEFYNEVMITRVLTEGCGGEGWGDQENQEGGGEAEGGSRKKVVGATGLDIPTGRFLLFQAKIVIMATGSAGRLWQMTADTKSATGEGFALARRVGTKLINMELVQYIPLTFVYPEFARGNTLGEASTVGKGTIYKNRFGERYIDKYDPVRLEATTRDIAARANYIEIKEGRGTPHGGIWVDPTQVDPKDSLYGRHRLPERWRMLRDFYGEAQANLKAPFEACPAALFMLGGIEINESCQTSTPHLYACGEAAANIHGANRLGGNALIDLQVFGQIAGEQAARSARELPPPQCPTDQVDEEQARVFGLLESQEGQHPIPLKKQLQELMWDKVGIVKSGPELEEAIARIAELKQAARSLRLSSSTKRYNQEWVEALELVYMLDVAEIMARCSLFREESRGAHYRTDFPRRNDQDWLKETVIQEVDGQLRLSTQPVTLTELQPKGPFQWETT